MSTMNVPPNVRYVEESYSETWPTATQYGSIQFGPVKEGMTIWLPQPMTLSKLPIEEQWALIQATDKSMEIHSTLLTWSMRLSMERSAILGRVRAEVISRVNDALALGHIRNAVRRDPQTGRPA